MTGAGVAVSFSCLKSTSVKRFHIPVAGKHPHIQVTTGTSLSCAISRPISRTSSSASNYEGICISGVMRSPLLYFIVTRSFYTHPYITFQSIYPLPLAYRLTLMPPVIICFTLPYCPTRELLHLMLPISSLICSRTSSVLISLCLSAQFSPITRRSRPYCVNRRFPQ